MLHRCGPGDLRWTNAGRRASSQGRGPAERRAFPHSPRPQEAAARETKPPRPLPILADLDWKRMPTLYRHTVGSRERAKDVTLSPPSVALFVRIGQQGSTIPPQVFPPPQVCCSRQNISGPWISESSTTLRQPQDLHVLHTLLFLRLIMPSSLCLVADRLRF